MSDQSHPATVSIYRQVKPNGFHEFTIEVRDTASRRARVRVHLTPHQLAMALSGMGDVSAAAEWRDCELAGKRQIRKPRQITLGPEFYGYSKEDLSRYLSDYCKEKGWVVDPFLGAQHSVVWGKDRQSVTLHYTVYRFEDLEEEWEGEP